MSSQPPSFQLRTNSRKQVPKDQDIWLGNHGSSKEMQQKMKNGTKRPSPPVPTGDTPNISSFFGKSMSSLNNSRQRTPPAKSTNIIAPPASEMQTRKKTAQKNAPSFHQATLATTKVPSLLALLDAEIDQEVAVEHKRKAGESMLNGETVKRMRSESPLVDDSLLKDYLSDDEHRKKIIKKEGFDVLEQMKAIDSWKPIEKAVVTEIEDFDDNLGLRSNITDIDGRNNYIIQKRKIDDKYKGKNYFPDGIMEEQLKKRVDDHIHVIEEVLNDLDKSYYYQRAKSFAKRSKKSVISAGEFNYLPKDEMLCGYYGTERQSSISNMITAKFDKDLKKLAKENKVVQFFTMDTFVLNFLTQELVTAMMMTELNISKEEAIDTLKNTNDYGTYVTNKMPYFEMEEDEIST